MMQITNSQGIENQSRAMEFVPGVEAKAAPAFARAMLAELLGSSEGRQVLEDLVKVSQSDSNELNSELNEDLSGVVALTAMASQPVPPIVEKTMSDGALNTLDSNVPSKQSESLVDIASVKDFPEVEPTIQELETEIQTLESMVEQELTGKSSRKPEIRDQVDQARNVVRSTTTSEVAGPSPMKEAANGAVLIESLRVDKPEFEAKAPRDKVAPKRELSGAEFLNARNDARAFLETKMIDRVKPEVKRELKQELALEPLGASIRSEWPQGKVSEPKFRQQSNEVGDFRAALANWNPNTLEAVTLKGRVTQGGMAQDRLSSESLLGLSQQISTLADAKGNGEIRMRLQPEHLGEIRLHVKTQGDNIGLSIQAAKPEAQKILEESLPSLRESLSQHRLTLAQVDVVTQPNPSASQGQTSMQSNDQSFGGSSMDQSFSGNSRQEREAQREPWVVERQAAQPQHMRRSQPLGQLAGRLDVVA